MGRRALGGFVVGCGVEEGFQKDGKKAW